MVGCLGFQVFTIDFLAIHVGKSKDTHDLDMIGDKLTKPIP